MRQSEEHVRKRIDARLRTLAVRPWIVSAEWLRAKYIDEGLDCVRIGALIDRDPKSVWSALKRYGIPTRGRGTHTDRHFKKGDPGPFAGKRHTEATKARIRETAIAQGRVPFDPKVGSYMRGRKGASTPNWKGGITPERQAFYQSGEWKAACVVVWHRADAKCERCSLDHRTVDRTAVKFHVHHVVSFMVRSLRAEPSNLALLCAACHRFVHSRRNTAREFLASK